MYNFSHLYIYISSKFRFLFIPVSLRMYLFDP